MNDAYLQAIRELQKILRTRRHRRKIAKALEGRPSRLVNLAERLQKI